MTSKQQMTNMTSNHSNIKHIHHYSHNSLKGMHSNKRMITRNSQTSMTHRHLLNSSKSNRDSHIVHTASLKVIKGYHLGTVADRFVGA